MIFLLSLLLALSAAYGLVFWAHRAETDRSARVGLYLVLGFPGGLLTVAGLALVVYGRNNGLLVLALGLGLALPLVKPLREALSRVVPIDPRSPFHMTGLSVFLGVLGLLVALALEAPEPTTVEGTVDYGQLIVQLLAWISLSYVVVGTLVKRNPQEANVRLGLAWPTPRIVLISFGAFFVAILVNGLAGALTAVLQPDVSDEIQRGLQELTFDLQHPIGAVLIGVTAGVGEELFFRGALQPRFGIVLTSILFALLHTNYGLSFVTLGVFGMGVVFGILRKRYGTVAPMITHGLVNFVAVMAQVYS